MRVLAMKRGKKDTSESIPENMTFKILCGLLFLFYFICMYVCMYYSLVFPMLHMSTITKVLIFLQFNNQTCS